MHKVVIIGAGFGGLAAARVLSGQGAEVTLVDQRNFHTFLPLLYEVATAGLDPADVAYPVRAVIGRTPNIRFRLGTVTGIVWQQRMVCFNDSKGGHDPDAPGCEDDVPYDSLILASGAIANFFGIPGAAEYTLPLCTLQDARHLRNVSVPRTPSTGRDLDFDPEVPTRRASRSDTLVPVPGVLPSRPAHRAHLPQGHGPRYLGRDAAP